MATVASLSFSLDSQPQILHHHHHHHHHCHGHGHGHSHQYPFHYGLYHATPFPRRLAIPFAIFPKSARYRLILPLSTSQSSSSSSTTSSSFLQNPLQVSRFLTNEEFEKLRFLENYIYHNELKSGSLWVRVMREEELDMTVGLLAESFGESMLLPKGYVKFLEFMVKQYLMEKRTLMPHNATLIGFYRESDEQDFELAGTVEVCFDKKGANASPPTPTPPKNSPYICNMTVKKPLRRRGIGWHLLKASEELISQMSPSGEVYLHCRIIDDAPFQMYTRAGYNIVKTDNILVLLTLQRRKHLMRKYLLNSSRSSEVDMPMDNIIT